LKRNKHSTASLIFDRVFIFQISKNKNNKNQRAVAWLQHHHMRTDIDITPNTYRFRQVSPKSLHGYWTKKSAGGMMFVVGYR